VDQGVPPCHRRGWIEPHPSAQIDALDDRQVQTSSSGEQQPEAGSRGLWGLAEDLVYVVEADGRPVTPAEPTELHRPGEAPAVVELSRAGGETLTVAA
jgi:hypothetical protein